MSRRKRGSKKRGKSKKKIFLLGGLGGGVLGIFLLIQFAASYLTRDYITSRVEESLNCRFELQEIEVSAFSSKASVTLKGVKMAKRDSFANDETPHDDRPKLTSSVVELGQVNLKFSWLDILFRNLNIQQISLEQVRAKIVLKEDGTNNLDSIFATPEDKERADKDRGKTFNILSNSGFVTHLRNFELKDSELELVVEKSQLKVKASDIKIDLLEPMEMDIGNLGAMKESKFAVSVILDAFSDDQKVQYGHLVLDGELNGKIFNPETGDFDPLVELKLNLGEESFLRQLPVVEKLADVFLGVRKFPLFRKLGEKKWKQTYGFKEQKQVHCRFHQNRYEFLAPLAVDVGDWTLQLESGSWFRATDIQHSFNYSLFAGKTMSAFLDMGLEKLFSILPEDKKKEAKSSLVYEDGRFKLNFESSGDLSYPSVKMTSKLPNFRGVKDQLLDDLDKGIKKGFLDLFGK